MATFRSSHLLHGGDYNPEQWLHRPEILEEDARLMADAGVNYVNLGIFSWSTLEPEEGAFDFDWMDACFERLHANGVGVLLATPCAARPLWLAHRYPEVRLTRSNGTLDPIGGRHNFCWSSPVYREKTEIIITRLSERYGNHPALLGWHVNNEYAGYWDSAQCHCSRCIRRFQKWLRVRYGDDLAKLNLAWWARFWSHNYQDWSQILPGDDTVEALILNWRRFSSLQVTEFLKHEVTAIRQHSSAPVATNLHGDGEHLDEWLIAGQVDFLGFDSYPTIDGTSKDIESMAEVAWQGARLRGLKPGEPWLLMESCPAQPQWKPLMRAKRPGVHRVLSLQNLANGADGVGYFQWRAGRGSSEKLHGAVLMQDAPADTRVFREVAALGRELSELSGIKDTLASARIALLWDTEQEWAWSASHGLNSIPSPRRRAGDAFEILWRHNLAVDVVSPRADLSNYDLLLAQGAFMLQPGVAGRLTDCVGNGAVLLTDALTGWVDDDLRICPGGRLGPEMRKLLGIRSEELDCLRDDESLDLAGQEAALKGAKGVLFCDRIHAENAEVLAAVEDPFHQGWPALTTRRHGQGRTFHLAVGLDREPLTGLLLHLSAQSGIKPPLENLPEGVLVSERQNANQRFFFILNPNDQPVEIPLPDGVLDGRDESPLGTTLQLNPWDARILKQAR